MYGHYIRDKAVLIDPETGGRCGCALSHVLQESETRRQRFPDVRIDLWPRVDDFAHLFYGCGRRAVRDALRFLPGILRSRMTFWFAFLLTFLTSPKRAVRRANSQLSLSDRPFRVFFAVVLVGRGGERGAVLIAKEIVFGILLCVLQHERLSMMFLKLKDEKVQAAEAKAGLRGFQATMIVLVLLLALITFTESKVISDPLVLLAIPFVIGSWTNAFILSREECTIAIRLSSGRTRRFVKKECSFTWVCLSSYRQSCWRYK